MSIVFTVNKLLRNVPDATYKTELIGILRELVESELSQDEFEEILRKISESVATLVNAYGGNVTVDQVYNELKKVVNEARAKFSLSMLREEIRGRTRKRRKEREEIGLI